MKTSHTFLAFALTLSAFTAFAETSCITENKEILNEEMTHTLGMRGIPKSVRSIEHRIAQIEFSKDQAPKILRSIGDFGTYGAGLINDYEKRIEAQDALYKTKHSSFTWEASNLYDSEECQKDQEKESFLKKLSGAFKKKESYEEKAAEKVLSTICQQKKHLEQGLSENIFANKFDYQATRYDVAIEKVECRREGFLGKRICNVYFKRIVDIQAID